MRNVFFNRHKKYPAEVKYGDDKREQNKFDEKIFNVPSIKQDTENINQYENKIGEYVGKRTS